MTKLIVALVATVALTLAQSQSVAQAPVSIRIRSLGATTLTDPASLRDSNAALDELARSEVLTRTASFRDVAPHSGRHERFQQRINGVPVWATTVTRQSDAAGRVVSIFGDIYQGLEGFSTIPTLAPGDARLIVSNDANVSLGLVPAPLYILPNDIGPRLVYVVRAAVPPFTVLSYFVDAVTGTIVEKRDDTKRQRVGSGTGVFGPDKKISTALQLGVYVATDKLRPPILDTYNMRGNFLAAFAYLNDIRPLSSADLAWDSDNRWSDAAVVDAHVHSGWTYDYLFKRFGRLGLDNRNLPIINIVHPADLGDVLQFGDAAQTYLVNAAYFGNGRMMYGDGLPAGFTFGGQTYDPLSGALDIVAHELAHGVTDYTSQLEYQGESGALNEAFSDMLGTSVEFYFHPAGTARGQADYLIGEDVIRPGGIRSLSNPSAFGQPDHYSRFVRTLADSGGVHINSGIPNHAFYLAIEGGRNRTSGLNVSGVGSANRQQIERIFYRAFTAMLPARASFATARAATIQTARDLFGAGSAAERAVTEAWTAVGVH